MRSNVSTLLKLELKNRFGDLKFGSTEDGAVSGKAVAKVILTIIFYAAVVVLLFFGARTIFQMFETANMTYESLVFFFTIISLFLLITGVSSTIKVLYYKGDNEILMRYPVKSSEVFISKTLFLFLTQFLITVSVIVPFMFAYGQVAGEDSSFYSMIPVVVILMLAISFCFANVIAIPIMQITNRIRNKYTLLLIIMSVLIAAAFAAYMIVFNSIVEYLRNSNYSVFSEEVVTIIKGIVKYLYPFRMFADIMVGKDLYIAYPALIMMIAILVVGMILVIVKLYAKTLLSNIELEGSAFKHKVGNRMHSVFHALLKKEFVSVFRSVNYSFQYLALACSSPVMVYFCNRIASQFGATQIGEGINTGLTLLVMMIFATVTASFASTSITREGKNFYQMKVLPVSLHTQLWAKFVMYMVVSVASNLICAGVLYFTKMMDLATAIWVFAIVQAASVAITLRAMRYDIKKPYFNPGGEGEVVNNNANTTRSVIFGFLLAIINGMVGMLMPVISGLISGVVGTTLPEGVELIACSGITLLVLVYSLLVYFIKLKKNYNSIVNR